ncbi:hypothetical protein GOP47_0008535 [Adiantum capillus-veneris]|uniref:Uncharacterized protein n=1 Tax=Adiantum capillus-veneris TaxID=13818 RepID=A0A9D4UYJ5_ADICA|nr:hypothetical protein GOP47_0008535 [Adiantum capillus-veneris]
MNPPACNAESLATHNNISTAVNDNQFMDESCSLDSHSHSQSQLQQYDNADQQQGLDCQSHQNPNHLINDSYYLNRGLAKGATSLLMLNMDEYESKSSSDNPDECEIEQAGRPTKKRYHRHSQHQIQEMERVFKECPHPDEKQRLELSRDLKLDPRQVKFWFQNKRTQVKAQHERHDNTYLRTENEKLRAENLALRDAMANVSCPNCGGPATLTDVSFDEQQLRIENVRLREEIDRISKIAAKHVGRPISALNLGSTLPSPTSTTNSTVHLPNETQGGNNSNVVDNEACNHSPLPISHRPIRLLECQKPMVVEHAMAALDELVQVAQAKEPLWMLDPLTNLQVLDYQQYFHQFSSNIVNHSPPAMRRESTRDTALVMMDSKSLVEVFMNVATWADMFSCIVSTALLVDILSSGTSNNHDGAMQLLYAEFQLPTPLVPTRESYFIRHAKQISNAQGTPMWVVVDVSLENMPRTSFSSSSLVRCRRRPSGCVIEDLPNGYSKVTWVEHFELDEYRGVHQLFEQLVSSGMAFGAKRWLSTLCRRCESLHAIHKSITNSDKDIVSPTSEGRTSILKLADRMTNSFCVGVNASITHTWITLSCGSSTTINSPNDGGPCQQLRLVNKAKGDALIDCSGDGNEVHGLGDDVRVLIRKSVDDPGRPPGVVLCAATSIWLPLPPSDVFHFLQDQNSRVEWDILSNMGVVEEILHVPKGHDDNNNNNVSLLRVNAASSNQPNMLILQECCADETSFVVVYAPVDIAAMSSVINGGDPDCVALLPSGFSIFPDGANYGHSTTQYLGNPSPPSGSLLTVAFQILVDHVPTAKLSLGSVATVNNLISSTVLRIKNALARDSACMH